MSFNFNFDDDDDQPFNLNEIMKMLQHMQQDLLNQLREQGIDPQDLIQHLTDPNSKKIGFSIHMGPDGQPHIKPLGDANSPFNFGQTKKPSKNGFEEPFVDVFHSSQAKKYQIIAEVNGIEDPDMVHLKMNDDNNILSIHAETGPFKYRTDIELDHPVDPDSLDYTLRNGVLEIILKAS